uniref:NADH-ubiquinone oxidoreductase chain 2 n=1 Tax=Meranoplus bicolor TaxID=611886 RepID=A0A8K1RD23_9HYME|nr:NADH dehydrogenase subunit 2 [Meranoplus bicolor]
MNFNMFFKYFININLLTFNLMPLWFYNLLFIWLMMEISNFFYICLMNFHMNNKKMIFFYFMIQMLASMLLIFSIILNNTIFNNYILNLILIISMMIKISIPPFHLWLPIISKSLTWSLLIILLTIQKIIPFYILSMVHINMFIFISIMTLCSILPPMSMMNLTNFKMLLSYSSINQSGWMIFLIKNKMLIWLSYFLFYSLILMSLIFLIYTFKITFNSNNIYDNKNFNMMFIFFMFSMAGLPPFSFFFMKWYSIFLFINSMNMITIMIMLMLSSLIMLYIYTNMMISSFFLFKIKSKMMMNEKNFINYFSLMIYSSLMFSLIILII